MLMAGELSPSHESAPYPLVLSVAMVEDVRNFHLDPIEKVGKAQPDAVIYFHALVHPPQRVSLSGLGIDGLRAPIVTRHRDVDAYDPRSIAPTAWITGSLATASCTFAAGRSRGQVNSRTDKTG
jgi:hypothetical protein